MVSVFNALASNRRKASRSAKAWAVRSLNKDGSVSKARVTDLCLASTMVEAETILARLRSLNPGKSFVVTKND